MVLQNKILLLFSVSILFAIEALARQPLDSFEGEREARVNNRKLQQHSYSQEMEHHKKRGPLKRHHWRSMRALERGDTGKEVRMSRNVHAGTGRNMHVGIGTVKNVNADLEKRMRAGTANMKAIPGVGPVKNVNADLEKRMRVGTARNMYTGTGRNMHTGTGRNMHGMAKIGHRYKPPSFVVPRYPIPGSTSSTYSVHKALARTRLVPMNKNR